MGGIAVDVAFTLTAEASVIGGLTIDGAHARPLNALGPSHATTTRAGRRRAPP